MVTGDVTQVPGRPDLHYVDTGMYEVAGYGCVYLLDGEVPALVESGIGTHHDRILAAMDAVGIDRADLETIALTHVHLDHAGGAGFLAEACPNADVYVHEVGAPHVVDPARLVAGTKQAVGDQWRYYVEPDPVPGDRVIAIEDGDAIPAGDGWLRAHHAPGHAPHQVVFADDRGAVYTGDAAGIWIPSRGDVHPTSPPPEFDLEQCLADVETIRDLDPEQLLFTHFGPVSTDPDGVLGDYAETLREWVADVRRVREETGDDEATVEHFVEATDVEEVWGEDKGFAEVAMNVRGVLATLDGGD